MGELGFVLVVDDLIRFFEFFLILFLGFVVVKVLFIFKVFSCLYLRNCIDVCRVIGC